MRRPMAISNWKMLMTLDQSVAWSTRFTQEVGDLLSVVDVVVCPAYTALSSVASALVGTPIALGAQNVAATTDPAHTGQISAKLVADAGCRWVMLGHWEVRRNLGDDDDIVNRKVHLCLEANLYPILFVGEGRDEQGPLRAILCRHLDTVLAGCRPDQVAQAAIVYEPEGAIGASRPATPAHVADGCGEIRRWLAERHGVATAEATRIVYGGSVAPEHTADLLAIPDLDGFGATRKGRDPVAFAQIVRQLVDAKSNGA